MILVNGISGRLVPSTFTYGVSPPDFAALGDNLSPLVNDLPSLTNRADSEWLWALLTPLSTTGTISVDDNGGLSWIDPADGTWTQDYRILVLPTSGATQVEDSTITLIVGGGSSGQATRSMVILNMMGM